MLASGAAAEHGRSELHRSLAPSYSLELQQEMVRQQRLQPSIASSSLAAAGGCNGYNGGIGAVSYGSFQSQGSSLGPSAGASYGERGQLIPSGTSSCHNGSGYNRSSSGSVGRCSSGSSRSSISSAASSCSAGFRGMAARQDSVNQGNVYGSRSSSSSGGVLGVASQQGELQTRFKGQFTGRVMMQPPGGRCTLNIFG